MFVCVMYFCRIYREKTKGNNFYYGFQEQLPALKILCLVMVTWIQNENTGEKAGFSTQKQSLTIALF